VSSSRSSDEKNKTIAAASMMAAFLVLTMRIWGVPDPKLSLSPQAAFSMQIQAVQRKIIIMLPPRHRNVFEI